MGQLSVDIGAGVRQTSSLVRDSIVAPVEVRAGWGPAFAVTLAAPLRSGWTAALTIDLGRMSLQRVEPGFADAALGAVYTVAAGISLGHALRAGVVGRAGVGAVRHFAESQGIFRRGAPPLTSMGWAVLRFEPSALGDRVAVEARYDLHRFTTPALDDVGFSAGRPVHRVALMVCVRVWEAP